MNEACAAAIPPALTARAQWVVWRQAIREGRLTKVPFRADGRGEAKTTDPETWATFGVALAACRRRGWSGVGFVFTAADPFAGIDLDDCRDPATGRVADWAREVLDRLDTYSEVSPSGTGVKAWVRAAKPGPRSRQAPHFELYDQGRYFAVTGRRLTEYPAVIQARQATFAALYEQIFGTEGQPKAVPPAPLAPATPLALDDEALLAKARAGAKGAALDALWAGTHAYGSASEADLALCGLLAFYAGPDPARIDGLFRRSGLFRSKWDTRHRGDGATYGQMTVQKALAGRTDFYAPRRPMVRETGAPYPSPPPSASPASNPVWEDPLVNPVWEHLPEFPTEALPAAVADYVRAVAETTQVPPDMPGMLALAVLAAAGSRLCVVQIGQTHAEPLNLYLAVVMEPGSRKSATLEAMAAPLREAEGRLVADRAPQIAAARERRAVEEKHLDGRRQAAAREEDAGARASLTAEVAAATEGLAPVPPLPRLLADDVTPEKLAGLLAEQDGVMAILSAEGGIFGILAGRYSASGGANLDLFLKAHAGEDFRSDRVGRASEHIPRATLTMGLAVQPAVLEALGGATGSFRGRGLLGRFLYSVPASLAGTRLYHSQAVDPAVREGYLALMRGVLVREAPGVASNLPLPSLVKLAPPSPFRVGEEKCWREKGGEGQEKGGEGGTDAYAADINSNAHGPSAHGPHAHASDADAPLQHFSSPTRNRTGGPGGREGGASFTSDGRGNSPGARHVLSLGGEALAVWAEYHDAVERRQGAGGDLAHVTDWASKLAGAVARIAGGLHLASHPDHPAPWDVPLGAETALAAWAVGEYLIPHALAAFARMAAGPAQRRARKVLAWLARTGRAEFSQRDAQRALAVTADEALAGLAVLVEWGYLRAQASAPAGPGRSPSPVFTVNPRWDRAGSVPGESKEAPNE